MVSAALDQFGRETGHHYDLSGKCYDPEIDRLGNVFQAFDLGRFGTFEEYMKDPDLFYFRASARGDYWEGKK